MATTIRDVARAAGVSVTTVSRVIHGNARVSHEARDNVLQAIERLHYSPSAVARALRTGRAQMLALVVPNIANSFFMQVARGIEKATDGMGFQLLVASTGGQPDKEARILANIMGRHVDAIVLASSGLSEGDVRRLNHSPIPIVCVDRRVDGLLSDTAVEDNRRGGAYLAGLVVAHHHQRVAVLAGPEGQSPVHDRLQGVGEVLRQAGINPTVIHSPFGWKAGQDVASTLLTDVSLPTAIIALQNQLAIGVLAAARSLAIKIPDDLSLVSYGLPEFNELLTPAVTGVDHRAAELGTLVGQRILYRLIHPDAPAQVDTVGLQAFWGATLVCSRDGKTFPEHASQLAIQYGWSFAAGERAGDS